MADEAPIAANVTPAPAAPAAAVAAPAPAPVAITETAPSAPTAEAAPIPVATPTPAPAPAPVAADAPTSILSEAKPETPPAAMPVVEVAPVTPPPPPVYESFKLPEGVTLDATKVTEFTKMLGDLELSGKADHAQVQAFGQRAVDLFIAEQQRQQGALVEQFNTIRTDWRNEIKNDPAFGGQNYTKSIADAGAFIEQYGGSAEEVSALRQMLRITGAGDNPHLIRALARAGKAIAREGSPVPASVPKSPNTVSKTAKRYAASLNGSGT